MKKIYQVMLPVYKQGDDMLEHLERTDKNARDAFTELVERYKDAADVARAMAAAWDDSWEDLEADTHIIVFSAEPSEKISRLEGLGVIEALDLGE